MSNLYLYLQAAIEEALRNEEGQGMVEYGLILALVSVVAILALTGIGNGVLATFNSVIAAL